MKMMKNLKARLLSLSLAFVMMVSLFAGMTPVEVRAAATINVSDIRVGDRLNVGDTVVKGSYSGNVEVRYCIYGRYEGVYDWDSYVIEDEFDTISAPASVNVNGWKVFDIIENDRNNRRVIQLCSDDEDGIFEQLTEPEVAVEKNAEGNYVLSIQKELGYNYCYMTMPLGAELEPGVTLTYEMAVGMVNGMLEEAFSYKALYDVFEEEPDGYAYTEAVNLGDTGVVIQVIKYSYDGNRWIQAGAIALVAGEPSGNLNPPAGGACQHTNLTHVPGKAPNCTEPGYYEYYICAGCEKLFADSQGTNEINAPETIPVDGNAHVWVTEKNERGHWATCSACSTANGSVDYPVAHTDNDSDNKCDVCEYVVYHVTFNANGLSVGGAAVRDTQGNRVSRFSDGETFLVPELCTVEVICYTAIDGVAAPGASYTFVAGEGIANTGCKVTDFTRNTVILLNPTPGNVVADEEVDNEAPIQGVEIKNGIDEFVAAKNIFTPEEVGRILTGEDASVRLVVDKIDTVPGAQKTDIEAKAAALGANANITYFDASLLKKVGNDAEQPVSNPGMDIEITIEIPQDLLNADSTKTRTYQLLRYHAGDPEPVSIINGSFSNGKFTFKTNKFSTYAIIYKDTAVATTNPGEGTSGGNNNIIYGYYAPTPVEQPVKDDVPKTGESVDYTAMVWTAMLAIGVAGLMFEKQKKRQ